MVLGWLIAQWPYVLAGGAVVGAIFSWVEKVKRIQQLELAVEQLRRALREDSRTVIKPSADEIALYGTSTAQKSLRRQVLSRPDTLLLLLAIIGPVLAFIFGIAREVRNEAERADGRIQAINKELLGIDSQLERARTELRIAEEELTREIAGQGPSHRYGEGPVAHLLRQRRDGLEYRSRDLEDKRRLLERELEIEKDRRQKAESHWYSF